MNTLGFQIRYRYELAPLSYLYVVYGRGGFDQDPADDGAGACCATASSCATTSSCWSSSATGSRPVSAYIEVSPAGRPPFADVSGWGRQAPTS